MLSLYIIYDWSDTCVTNIARLTGAAVSDPRVVQKILLLAWRFAPVVEGYKTFTAYHAGDGVWVEVDVIMPRGEKVGRAHDVAETLQYCLEGLREVDRAFVSVDCKFLFFIYPFSLFFWSPQAHSVIIYNNDNNGSKPGSLA